MTEKLYLRDAYLREFDARVVRVSGNAVVLDRTAFYPEGGGQPNDKGTITINNSTYNVLGLEKDGDDIVHILDKETGVGAGSTAEGKIDWAHRYACMRYHTALHTIDGIIETVYKSGMITGGQIYPDRARMDIDMPDLNKEKVAEILDRTNSVAREGHDVLIKEIGRADALAIPSLSRTEPGRRLLEKLESVRVVEIVGVDTQADGGTHVKNTNEIGTIALSSYENKGARRKRIEIVLT
jgi:misacylated tRNA(Ala) deacylase